MRLIAALIVLLLGTQSVLADARLCYNDIPKIDMRKVAVMGVRNPTWYCDRVLTFRHASDTPKEWQKKLRKRRAVQNGSIWIGRVLLMFLLPVPTMPIACAIPTKNGWAIFLHERHVRDGRLKDPRRFVPRHELAHVACDTRMWR